LKAHLTAMAVSDSNIVKLAPEAGAPAYRSAPHNIEAEQSLLGAILVNNDAFYRVSDFLEQKHFFEPIHQLIFETAASLIRAGKVATPVTLKTFLPADTDLGGITVSQYLARLAAEATTIINAQDYGRTIYDLSQRRDLIRIGEDMVNVAYDAPVDFAPRAQIEDAERRLYELAEQGQYDGGFQKFGQALTIAIDMAAAAYQRDGNLSGLASGLREMDVKMGGLQPSDLIILAGRPAMGKTALMVGLAEASSQAGIPTGIISAEQPANQLGIRRMALASGVGAANIRAGKIADEQWSRISVGLADARDRPLWIYDRSAVTLDELVGVARKWKHTHNIGILFIDYAQRITVPGVDRITEVSTIARGLKNLARNLQIPVVSLAQVKAAVDTRPDKRPTAGDLANSDELTREADQILMLYRDEVYARNGGREVKRGVAEILIEKNRHGPTGFKEVAFMEQTMRFADLERDGWQ
jgi:replicative DNA helicase